MKITEKGFDFTELGIDEYELLEEAVREKNIAFLKSKIEESKLDPPSRFVAWRDARPDFINWSQVSAFLGTVAGARKALDKSLELSGVDEGKRKEAIAKFSIVEASNLARRLVHFITAAEYEESKAPKN